MRFIFSIERVNSLLRSPFIAKNEDIWFELRKTESSKNRIIRSDEIKIRLKSRTTMIFKLANATGVV